MAPQIFLDRFGSLDFNSVTRDAVTLTQPLSGLEVPPNSRLLAAITRAEPIARAEPLDVRQIVSTTEITPDQVHAAAFEPRPANEAGLLSEGIMQFQHFERMSLLKGEN